MGMGGVDAVGRSRWELGEKMEMGGVDGNWGRRWKLEEKMGMERRRRRGEDRKMNLKRIGGVDWNGKERGRGG
jgi:hypothetical protein